MAVEGEVITESAKPLNTVSLGPGGPPSSTVAWKRSLGWELGHLQGPCHLLPSLRDPCPVMPVGWCLEVAVSSFDVCLVVYIQQESKGLFHHGQSPAVYSLLDREQGHTYSNTVRSFLQSSRARAVITHFYLVVQALSPRR